MKAPPATDTRANTGRHPAIGGVSGIELEKDLARELIELALREDIGDGDLTSKACIEPTQIVKATVAFKEKGVIAGLEYFAEVFSQVDPRIDVELLRRDGDLVEDIPARVARIAGPAPSMLSAERTALNLLQHLSGIATLTRKYVDKAGAFGIAILDTRKTTPGLRALEKYAVRTGGGVNHRFSLADAILIKDNHIRLAGGIARAAASARSTYPGAEIEVEAETLDQVREALGASVDAIMLDNMAPDMVRKALTLIEGRCFVELSGGINLKNIESYLIQGVDAVSVGAVTHSAPNIDISMEIED